MKKINDKNQKTNFQWRTLRNEKKEGVTVPLEHTLHDQHWT